MSLAIDASSPAKVTGTGALTTASFTPPNGSLVVVRWSGNSTGGFDPSAPSITDNLGTHLTYTQVAWAHRGNTGVNGQASIWTAPVGTGSPMTVTVTNNAGSSESALLVEVWTGQDPVPTGASGFNWSTSANSISQSYTASATSGQGVGVVCDWDTTGTETAGTGCTVDAGTVASQVSYCFVRRTADDDVAGVGNSLNTNLPGTSTNLSWVWVELLPLQQNPTQLDPPPFVIEQAPGLFQGPNSLPAPWAGVLDAPAQPLSLAVTATEGGSTFNGIALTVKVLTGASLTQNGAHNNTTNIATPSLAITPNATGSIVYGSLTDATGATSWTTLASSTFFQNFVDATNGATYGLYRSAATTTALTPVTLGASAPTSRSGGLAQAEIRAIGVLAEDVSSPPGVTNTGGTTVSTAQFTPPAGSLLVAMVGSDGNTGTCTMTVSGGGLTWTEVDKANAAGFGYAGVWIAQVPGGTPIPPMVTQPARRRPIPILRRPGRSSGPVPAQVVVAPPAYPPVGLRSHVKFWQVWRGHQATPVPPQVVIAAPPFVPLTSRPKLRAVLARRPRTATPPAQPGIVQVFRTRLRMPRWIRGRSATPVPPQVAVTPPAYPPVGVRSHVKFWQTWRSHGATPVPPQVIITPPAYPPQGLRQRARALRLYRGHQATPVPPQITVTPPAFVSGQVRPARMRAVMVRRGRAAAPPVAQTAPPLIVRVKLRLARVFRGRLGKPTPPQVVIPPPAYPPQAARAKHWLWAARRHRAGVDGWMVGGTHLCVTPRPNTGTTGRPGSGTTAYNTATTSRPSTGITARPNTGETPDPC